MIVDANGMKRTERKPRYDKIYFGFLTRLGESLAEGAEKYDANILDDNWQKGDEKSATDTFNHLIDHMYKFRATAGTPESVREQIEDHLGHAAANIMMLCYYFDRGIYPKFLEPITAGKELGLHPGVIEAYKEELIEKKTAGPTVEQQLPLDFGDQQEEEMSEDEEKDFLFGPAEATNAVVGDKTPASWYDEFLKRFSRN